MLLLLIRLEPRHSIRFIDLPVITDNQVANSVFPILIYRQVMALFGGGRHTVFCQLGTGLEQSAAVSRTTITKDHKLHLQWEGRMLLSSSRLRLQRISITFGMTEKV